MNSVYFWLSFCASGVSLYSLVWVLGRPAIIHKKRPAVSMRRLLLTLSWPWVVALVPLTKPFLPWRTRQLLQRGISVAGLDDEELLPEHVFAMQSLLFMLTALVFMVVYRLYMDMASARSAFLAVSVALLVMWWPRLWLRDLGAKRQRQMLRELPFLLDMTTLCVEAGLNLSGALQQAASHGPDGPLRDELRRSLNDMRAGVQRMTALGQLANRTGLPALSSLVTSLAQADQLGMSLGPLLRSQSEQRRSERFLRAEKLALEAPVKMLFPMVLCIFPCTFLIIGFPIMVKLLGSGL